MTPQMHKGKCTKLSVKSLLHFGKQGAKQMTHHRELGPRAIFSNAWGVGGVEKFFSLPKRELTTTMMLLGVTGLSQLDRTYVNTKAVENLMS
ncbi:unnamed protein product [Rhizoctonia solani]|uniref:FMN-dependent dehydrogenase domain-containing protein n=1 Tax=Rhizoctonia solani TaxID=456999 RepID=A0A8H3D558_9AGAM|nr:unnamed protein product [Rhizoctonia solani]